MSGLHQCEDVMLFQRTLKKLRDIDDKIIYALNLSTPTKSFQVCSWNVHEPHSFSFHKTLFYLIKTSFSSKTISFSYVKLFKDRGADTQERCHQLQRDLAQSHQDRDSLIKGCIQKYSEEVAATETAGDKLKRRTAQNMVRERNHT